MNYLMKRLFLFFLMPFALTAQESDFADDVLDYLEFNGTLKHYERDYDEFVTTLEDLVPRNEQNAIRWDQIVANKPIAINELKIGLIALFQDNFTHKEILLMAAFYKSETGRILINDQANMTKIHTEILSKFYNSELGLKMMRKQEYLAQEMGRLSEEWTRDLYETSLPLLSNG